MSTWSVNGVAVANLRIVRRSMAVDLATFDVPVSDFTADPAFAFKEAVTITGPSGTAFVGRVRSIPVQGTPQGEFQHYEVAGPWEWLEKIVYQQNWRMYNVVGGVLDAVPKSRVILCQDADGTPITNGTQIEAAIDYAISRGAPIAEPAVGDIDPALYLPWDEQVDLSCADVIIRMLRWCPDVACWFDYTGETPRFKANRIANATELSLAIAGGTDGVQSVRITPRYDLQVPGVVVKIERTDEIDNQALETVEVQEAGDTDDPECLITTMELAGMRESVMRQEIVTEDWPDPLTDKAWWKAHCKALEDVPDADITIADVTRTGTMALPRILAEGGGTIQEWMDGIETEEETVTAANVTIKVRDGYDAQVREEKRIPLSVTVTATNAETKRYSALGSAEQPEPSPAGLAAALYAAWNRLQYDGDVTIAQEECSVAVCPGYKLNLTGGRSEWASMNALVQAVTEQIDTGTTTIQFGPARHLGPDELRQLLVGFRRRAPAYTWRARTTGKTKDRFPDKAVVAANRNEVHQAPGEVKQLLLQHDEPATQQIELEPGDADSVGKVVQVAEVAGVKVAKLDWPRFHA